MAGRLLLATLICLLVSVPGVATAHEHHAPPQAKQTLSAPPDTLAHDAPHTPEETGLPRHHADSPAAAASSASTSYLEQAADLHAAIVHFPIAWVLMVALWEAWALARRRQSPEVGLPLALLAALAFLPAAATGLLHADLMQATSPLSDLIDFHKVLALTSALLMILAAALRLGLRRRPSTGLRAAYLIILAVVLVLCLSAGQQGGLIVRSEM